MEDGSEEEGSWEQGTDGTAVAVVQVSCDSRNLAVLVVLEGGWNQYLKSSVIDGIYGMAEEEEVSRTTPRFDGSRN